MLRVHIRCLAGRMAMHACQIGPTDTAPLARDRHYGPASRQRGERFGAGNLSAPISPLTLFVILNCRKLVLFVIAIIIKYQVDCSSLHFAFFFRPFFFSFRVISYAPKCNLPYPVVKVIYITCSVFVFNLIYVSKKF